jgi:hypothetical protein
MGNQCIGNALLTDTTLTDLVPAPGSGLRTYITSILVTNSHDTNGTLVTLKDDTSGGTNILCQGYAAKAGGGFFCNFTSPRAANENQKIQVQCGTTGANVYVSVSGYKDM